MSSLIKSYNTLVENETDEKIVYRASCANRQEINKWLLNYEKETCTKWIVNYNLKDPEK
jgi:hypothetical protein